MARKRYQRGSLQLRGGKQKKWVLIWREDVEDPETRVVERQQRVTQLGTLEELPTKLLARRKADLALASSGINSLDYRPRMSMLLREVAQQWKDIVLVHQKVGTQMKAQDHLRAHILPAFGEQPLDSIGTREVQYFITRLAPRMKSKSIKNVLGTLNGICKTAKDWGLTPAPWRMEDLKIPKDKEPKRKTAFTIPQVRDLLLRAPQPARAIFALCVLAAMRGGEVLGLHREHLDLEKAQVAVLWSLGPKRNLQSVKSTKSERSIPLVPALVEILRDYLDNHSQPNPLGLMFVNQIGRPMSHTKILEDHLWPLLEKMNLPKRGLHAFRHTATSLLIEEGVPLPMVQEIVGHEDMKTTLSIYAHVIRPEHREAIGRLGKLFCDLDVTGQNVKYLVQ